MPSKTRGCNIGSQPAGEDRRPYEGLLAELPNVSVALLDPDKPPLWLARWAVALEKNGVPEVEIHEAWKDSVLEQRKQEGERHLKCYELLFRHFNIDAPNDWAPEPNNIWYQLSMALLASEPVPAFQFRHALEEQGKPRADKPLKLDTYGSACLFLCRYLEDVSKRRPLTATEERCLKDWTAEVEQRNLGESTKRSLRQQMLEAHVKYWAGQENAFQRQFVEKVDPLIADLFDRIAAARAGRTH